MAYNHLPDSVSLYESELDDDLASFGIPPLPVHYIRQTPKQALSTAHFWINYIICFCINFGANVGVGIWLNGSCDEVGLWEKPDTDHPYGGAIWSDFLVVCFIITFFNTLLASWGLGK